MATFTFSGDPNAPGTDPATCEVFGMTFPFGEKVKVEDAEIAEKLRRHSHFTEVKIGRPPSKKQANSDWGGA